MPDRVRSCVTTRPQYKSEACGGRYEHYQRKTLSWNYRTFIRPIGRPISAYINQGRQRNLSNFPANLASETLLLNLRGVLENKVHLIENMRSTFT